MNRITRRSLGLALAALAAACGGDSVPEGPDTGGDAGDDSTGDAVESLPSLAVPPAPPVWLQTCSSGRASGADWGPCLPAAPLEPRFNCERAPGWTVQEVEGVRVCAAPHPPETCSLGFMPSASADECIPFGSQCSDDAMSEGEIRRFVPEFNEAPIVTVGGRGSDFAGIEEALQATDGELIVVLSEGSYRPTIDLDGRRVALVGACVESTSLGPVVAATGGELIMANLWLSHLDGFRVEGFDATLRDVLTRNCYNPAVHVVGSRLHIERVWMQQEECVYPEAPLLLLEGATMTGTHLSVTGIGTQGVRATERSEVQASQVLLRGGIVGPDAMGLSSESGSSVTLEAAIISRFSFAGVWVDAADFDADTATFRQIRGQLDARQPGFSMVVENGGNANLRRVLLNGDGGAGMLAIEAQLRVEDSLMRHTAHTPRILQYGAIRSHLSDVELERVWIIEPAWVGVSSSDGSLSLTDTLVRGSGSSDSSVTFSPGIRSRGPGTLVMNRVAVEDAGGHGMVAENTAASGSDLTVANSLGHGSVASAEPAVFFSESSSVDLDRVVIRDSPTMALRVSTSTADLRDVWFDGAGSPQTPVEAFALLVDSGRLGIERGYASGLAQGFAAAAWEDTLLHAEDLVVEEPSDGSSVWHFSLLAYDAGIELARSEISAATVGIVAYGELGSLSLVDTTVSTGTQSALEQSHSIELLDGAGADLTRVALQDARGVALLARRSSIAADSLSVQNVTASIDGHAHGVVLYESSLALSNADLRGVSRVALAADEGASALLEQVQIQESGVCIAHPSTTEWLETAVSLIECEVERASELGFSGVPAGWWPLD